MMRHATWIGAVVIALVAVEHAAARCPSDAVSEAAVADARAQVASTCDCAGTSSHAAFVACAAGVVRALRDSGALPRGCQSEVTRCAAASTCGLAGAVTCCRAGSRTTRCRRARSAPECTARGGRPCMDAFPACCPNAAPPPTTSTTLPLTCDSSGAPSCGGTCPPGQVCQAGQTIQGSNVSRFCACVAAAATCAPVTSDCDFGVCPPGQSCTMWFDIFFCGCMQSDGPLIPPSTDR